MGKPTRATIVVAVVFWAVVWCCVGYVFGFWLRHERETASLEQIQFSARAGAVGAVIKYLSCEQLRAPAGFVRDVLGRPDKSFRVSQLEEVMPNDAERWALANRLNWYLRDSGDVADADLGDHVVLLYDNVERLEKGMWWRSGRYAGEARQVWVYVVSPDGFLIEAHRFFVREP